MTLEQREPVLKVVSVSNNILLLLGLRRLFEVDNQIVVVGESSTSSSTCNVIAQQRPNVILLDIESDMKFPEAIHDLRQKHPPCRIVILSGWAEMDRARQALAAGADEIVLKCQRPEVLLATVQGGGKGPALALRAPSNQPPITTKVDNGKAVAEATQCTDALTDREGEVVSLVGKGLSNRDIASKLCISETTVRHHLTSIFDKIGVSNRQKLLIYAYQYGLVEVIASA